METLETIKQWFSDNAPKVLDELVAPATESEIDLVESETEIKLPEEFKDFLRTHNGANGFNPLFGDGHEFLTCEQIIEQYRFDQELGIISGNDLQQYLEWKEMATENYIDISGPVKPHESCSNWLPISNQNGDVLRYLDFDPAEGGTLGQVIEVDPECRRWEVLAPSFEAFLSTFHDELVNGYFEVNEEGGIDKKEECYQNYDSWPVPDWLLAIGDEPKYATDFDSSNWHLDLRVVPEVAKFLSSDFPVDITLYEWQDWEPSKIDSNFYELTWAHKNGGLFIAFSEKEEFKTIASKIKKKSKKIQRVKLKLTLVKHSDSSNKKSHPKWKCWLEAYNVELVE